MKYTPFNALLTAAAILIAAFCMPPFEVSAGALIGRAPNNLGISNGLIGYWSFDGKDMAGIRTYDRSGLGNHGLHGSPTRTSGKIGQGLDFSGDGFSFVLLAADASTPYASFTHLGTTTISVWIYPRRITADVANNYSMILDTHQSGVNNGWNAGLCTNGDIYGACTGMTNVLRWAHQGVWTTPNNSITLNSWNHIVIAQASGTVPTIYINGVPQVLTTGIAANGMDDDSNNVMTLGDQLAGEVSFDGVMDDLRIYNRVISSDEIKRLYKIGATAKVGLSQNNASLADNLIGWWTFDGPDMAGIKAFDRSPNGNHGFLGSPSRGLGRLGQALDFSGGTNSFALLASGAFTPYPTLTHLGTTSMSVWVFPRRITADESSDYGAILDVNQGGVNNGWTTGLCRNGDLYGICSGTMNTFVWNHQGTWVTPNNSIQLNAWNHILVAQASGTAPSIYINGALQSLTTVNAANGTDDDSGAVMTLGDRLLGDVSFDGIIDDLRLYDRVLFADDVRRLYKMGATAKVGVASVSGSLAEGLVGHWTFDGKDMTSTNAMDRSGQSNHGTLMNGSTPAIGKIGQALEFDGTDDEVRNTTLGALTSAWTVSAWIRSPAPPGTTDISSIVQSRGRNLEIRYDSTVGNEGTLGYTTGGGGYVDIDYGSITPDSWHHVAGTWDGITLRSYNNGVLENAVVTGSTPGDDGGDPTIIGCNVTFGGCYDGLIDDVRIYNRPLSSEEITRLYLMGR